MLSIIYIVKTKKVNMNKKTNTKKDIITKIISTIIIILIVLLLIVLLPILIIFGSLIYYMSFDVRTIGTYTNEQNNYTIKYQEIGCAAFFGPTKVKITLYNEKGRKKEWFYTKLFNDGKSPTNENITIIWLDDRVKIVIDGEEQSPDVHEIKY